jgi:hypothetical protein
MDAAEEALAHCQITSLLSRYYQALDVLDLDTLESEVMGQRMQPGRSFSARIAGVSGTALRAGTR